jgi:hypothetical protein
MCANVLASDVGAEALISELVVVKDDAALQLVGGITERPRTQEQAQLQRHVEAWKARLGVELYAGNVVDRIGRLTDDSNDFLYANFAGVFNFQRAARDESTVMNSEDKST